ncbi:MAG: hypothetical protein WCG31_03485 [Deltaproteobacteria bacterium]
MKSLIAAFLLCLLSTGLASAAAPAYEKLAKLPVVEFGEAVPETDHILLFPAGKPITITITIEGTLFSRTASTILMVTPSREILIYREWASLDGIKWILKSDLIKSDVMAKIPGYNHPQPGILKVRMDLAETR